MMSLSYEGENGFSGGGGGCDMGNTGKVREKVENGVDDHDADGGPVSRNPFCTYVASSVEVRRGDQHTS